MTTKARSRKAAHAPAPVRTVNDGVVYLGLTMIGLFALFIWGLLVQTQVRAGIVGLVAAAAVLVNFYAWRAYAGDHQANWKEALARIPLRFAGFGTKGGRSLRACHGQPKARTALLVCALVSIVIVVAVAWFVLPITV
ncbi:MAG: hypothetical protein KDA25_12335 [Phycisphaerales bacterium]|nr:hypothetical protein [Phycisphaerales bacterium]